MRVSESSLKSSRFHGLISNENVFILILAKRIILAMEREVCCKHFKSIGSTNDYAKEHLDQFDLSMLNVVSADRQTDGHGTRGKSWLSPEGGIYVTFVIPHVDVLYQAGLVLAISCLKVFEQHRVHAQIRWPNDLLLNEKKIGGILAEPIGDVLVIGVGINVTISQDLLDTVDQAATSINCATPHQILEALIAQFNADLALFSMSGFDPFFAYYREKIAYMGERVTVTVGEKVYTGVLKSVLPDGLLQLETAPKSVMTVVSGQIRKVKV